MEALTRLTASALADKLRSGEVSSVEATQAHLDRIAEVDGDIHAFLHVSATALDTAAAIDARRAAGEKLGPLAGIPIAIKDVLCTIDMPSTAGSRILEGWVPPYDATVVRKLREAGLVPLGKTNMDEFAMGSSTEHSAFGPTHNPWDLDRIPGGSGGGSAAAVAAFEAPLALGSDTGGSIRQPAAVTGSVGMKPTYGGVSRYGAIALASSLDQVGPVTRSVLDAALLHDVIGGYDPRDSTSLPDVWPSFAAAAREGAASGTLAGVRVGVVKELGGEGFQAGVSQRFAEALDLLAAAGAEIVEVSAPSFTYAIAAYYLILPAEASSNLAKFDSVRFGMRVNPPGGGTVEDVMSATREAGIRRRGQTPHHPGHLRPLGRLLRRLLRQCAEGAHADPARLRRRVREGGRADQPGGADHGVQARRETRGPAGHVPQRHHHHPGEPRRRSPASDCPWGSRRKTACPPASS